MWPRTQVTKKDTGPAVTEGGKLKEKLPHRCRLLLLVSALLLVLALVGTVVFTITTSNDHGNSSASVGVHENKTPTAETDDTVVTEERRRPPTLTLFETPRKSYSTRPS